MSLRNRSTSQARFAAAWLAPSSTSNSSSPCRRNTATRWKAAEAPPRVSSHKIKLSLKLLATNFRIFRHLKTLFSPQKCDCKSANESRHSVNRGVLESGLDQRDSLASFLHPRPTRSANIHRPKSELARPLDSPAVTYTISRSSQSKE